VHLWMRYSYNKPLKHQVERFRRGLAMPWNTYYCFTAWHELEQDEPGDTLEHTFSFTDWPVCETRWFYFTGTKRLFPSPSASPIFELHRYEPAPTRIAYSRHFSTSGTFRRLDPIEGHAMIFHTGDTPPSLDFVYLFTQTNDTGVLWVGLYKCGVDHKPTGDLLASSLVNPASGERTQDANYWQTVYRHRAWLWHALEADTDYAIVTVHLEGGARWLLRFRHQDWEGDKDEGWENQVTLFITYDGGANYVEAYPYYQCYEVWGSQ